MAVMVVIAGTSDTSRMSNTWAERLGTGWRVVGVVEGVRHEGVVVRLNPEHVKFVDDKGVEWLVSRDRVEVLGPPG